MQKNSALLSPKVVGTNNVDLTIVRKLGQKELCETPKLFGNNKKEGYRKFCKPFCRKREGKKKTTISSQMLEQKTPNKQGGKKNLRDGFAVTKPHSKWSAYQTAVCCY
jgi:hypothetical protein